MKKDNIDLVWSVSELSGLFERKSTVTDFLQEVVELIASHTKADVCSIYLYDEASQLLYLRATRGLEIEGDRTVSLALGEGITGRALKELRPIRSAHASRNPHFKYIPDIGEEGYESFLAVPIKRSLNRIGVMVVQHHTPDYFDVSDSRALQAIASQLAATLENAEVLITLHNDHAKQADHAMIEDLKVVHGRAAAEGFAEGRAVLLSEREERARSAAAEPVEDPQQELNRFTVALQDTRRQLEELQRQMEDDLADVASLIFSSHLLMLMDREFCDEIRRLIVEGRKPESAVREVVHTYVELLERSGNLRTQEKTQDLHDLEHRLLRNLSGDEGGDGDYTGQIVIAPDILPSELVRVSAQHAEGLILGSGGVTAHVSILARSLGIPVVAINEPRVFHVPEHTPVILDAFQGNVYLNPDEHARERLVQIRESLEHEEECDEPVPELAHTLDGVRVQVQANINIVYDVKVATQYRAEGIGLYRSEFPFIVRNDFPTEDEQYYIYRKIVSSMPDRPVVLRTLDIGGDKVLQQPAVTENNPFLGFRGIRFSLDNVELFKEQLRAMLRAGAHGNVQILLPMISSIDEFQSARAVLDECIAELRQEGIPFDAEARFGAMIELPSAVSSIEALADEADFLSVGTNDLVMYMLAVDRTNTHVGKMYKHYHPAVLHALKAIATAMSGRLEQLSICGDAAYDPAMLPFLVGIGFRTLSVEPRMIAKIKRALSRVSIDEAQKQAARMLECRSIAEIESLLQISTPSTPDESGETGKAAETGRPGERS